MEFGLYKSSFVLREQPPRGKARIGAKTAITAIRTAVVLFFIKESAYAPRIVAEARTSQGWVLFWRQGAHGHP
jgi:hypothetical protein